MEIALSKDRKYDAAKEDLANFFSGIGTDKSRALSSVDNFATWIELMSVTGIFHGATLSMTRVLLTPSVLAQVDPTSPKLYSSKDYQVFLTGTATIVGAEKGRYVFSDEYFDYKFASREVNKVAKQYSKDVSELKQAYYDSFKSSPEKWKLFKNYGWLLADYAPDFVDGRQSTITTYI